MWFFLFFLVSKFSGIIGFYYVNYFGNISNIIICFWIVVEFFLIFNWRFLWCVNNIKVKSWSILSKDDVRRFFFIWNVVIESFWEEDFLSNMYVGCYFVFNCVFLVVCSCFLLLSIDGFVCFCWIVYEF